MVQNRSGSVFFVIVQTSVPCQPPELCRNSLSILHRSCVLQAPCCGPRLVSVVQAPGPCSRNSVPSRLRSGFGAPLFRARVQTTRPAVRSCRAFGQVLLTLPLLNVRSGAPSLSVTGDNGSGNIVQYGRQNGPDVGAARV